MASQSFARGARAVADEQAVLAAAAHLTDRDRYLVRMVCEHRVLTTEQLAALGFDNVITARHRLGVLAGIGVLRRFRPRREIGSAPWHYLLGPFGAALLGAEDRDERKWVPQVRADRQLALVGSQRLAHLTGANWFFVSLAAHARTGGGELRVWLGEHNAAEHLLWLLPPTFHPEGLPRPDGLGTWAQDGREVIEALIAEIRITEEGVIPVFRIPGPRTPVPGGDSSAITAGTEPVRAIVRSVGRQGLEP